MLTPSSDEIDFVHARIILEAGPNDVNRIAGLGCLCDNPVTVRAIWSTVLLQSAQFTSISRVTHSLSVVPSDVRELRTEPSKVERTAFFRSENAGKRTFLRSKSSNTLSTRASSRLPP